MTYLPVSKICERYGISRRTVYRFYEEIRNYDRYKKAWISINDEGTTLFNTLVLEDFLRHRTELKHKNLARRLQPYNPKEVRWQRGEDDAREKVHSCS